MIGKKGAVSLLGAIELVVFCALLCGVVDFHTQTRETLVYK